MTPASNGARLREAIVIASIAVLPFAMQPFRLEQFETQRAGMLGLLVALLLLLGGHGRLRLARQQKSALLSLGLWVLALTVAAVLSLSPARSLLGDMVRRMGLVTQLALLAGVYAGMIIDIRAYWRWLWLSGTLVSLYIILEATGVLWPYPLTSRPPGPFGSSTFTGGWLALVIVWVSSSLPGGWLPRTQQAWIDSLGLGLMLVAAVLTGARGSLIALAAGIGAIALAGLIRSKGKRWRYAVCLALIAAFAAVLISGLPLGDRTLSGLKLESVSSAFEFRRLLWRGTQDLAHTWPTLTAVDGTTDSRAALRPLFGYGPEMFEPPYRLQFDVDIGVYALGQRIDRAHNDWLDTLIDTGWIGLAARLLLWTSLLGLGLRRVGWRRSFLWLLLPLGMAVAVVARGTSFLPLTATLGGVIGLWLLIVWPRDRARATSDVAPLAVLVTHLIDLQFSFITVATGWLPMLAAGSLIAPRRAHPTPAEPTHDQVWAWNGLAGMYLIRYLFGTEAHWSALACLLIAAVALCRLVTGQRPQRPIRIGVFWLFGVVGAFVTLPEFSALWDVAALLLTLWSLAGIPLPPLKSFPLRTALSVTAAAVVLLLWGRDIAADIHAHRATVAVPAQAVEEWTSAARLRPWDDRLLGAAGQAALDATSSSSANSFGLAAALFERAAQLNRFDAGHALQLAGIEANLALMATDRAPHIQAADGYFDAAAHMWPFEVGVWREWGRFALQVQHNRERALDLLHHAAAIDAHDADTLALLAQANRADSQ